MSRRIAVVLMVLGLLALMPSARAVGECLELSLDCAGGTVATDPGEVLDDPNGTIEDAVDGAEDTTDPVVGPVKDVVDDLLNGGGPVDPPIIGGDGPGAHESGPGAEVDGRERVRPDPGTPTARPDALSREALLPPETIIGSAATGTNPPVAPGGSPGRFEGFVEGAVRGFLVLAVLFGITLAFVAAQGRLDRNDPKLVAAPVRTEIVTFG